MCVCVRFLRALRPLTFSLRRSESVCGSVGSLMDRVTVDKLMIDRALVCDKPILYCGAIGRTLTLVNLLGKNALDYLLGILPTTPRRSIRIRFTLGKKKGRPSDRALYTLARIVDPLLADRYSLNLVRSSRGDHYRKRRKASKYIDLEKSRCTC